MELLRQNGMIEKIAAQIIAYNNELQENPKLAVYEKQLAECEKSLENITSYKYLAITVTNQSYIHK
jgi:hypothetical protein